MTVRELRRRFGQTVAAHDWLEGASGLLGLVFLAAAVASAWAVVIALTSLGDAEPGLEGSRGLLEATRGLGVLLFGAFAVISLAVGWFLAGEAVRRGIRRLTRRG